MVGVIRRVDDDVLSRVAVGNSRSDGRILPSEGSGGILGDKRAVCERLTVGDSAGIRPDDFRRPCALSTVTVTSADAAR